MTQPSIADVFQVQGDTLLYNGEALNGYDAIRAGHEEQLLKILQTHKNIKLLKLTIDGGTKRIAMEMANIIIDAQLDTNGDKKCSSSCVRLLLAGTKRTANLGAQIGFHRGYWLAEGMEIYYKSIKKIWLVYRLRVLFLALRRYSKKSLRVCPIPIRKRRC